VDSPSELEYSPSVTGGAATTQEGGDHGGAISIRELLPEETALAYDAMRELHHFGSATEFATKVNNQRVDGYRLVATFEAEALAAAAAGFRTGHSIAWGRYLYIDDLVTREHLRRRGHGRVLMEWLFGEARRLGCDMMHLDSRTHRHDSHRFYLNCGLRIAAFHFDIDLRQP
jgi:GNAT superfamily N-acetyltransferase